MWETPSHSLIIPLTCLIMAGKIHAQCEKPLVGEESSLMWNFPEESTVAFTCSTGYQPVDSGASNSITCKEKQWTTLDLQCKKKSCGNPGEVSNGKYSIPDGIEYLGELGEYAVFGPKTRTCQENGWDGKPAVCELVKCLPPPTIQNGIFEPEDESYGYNEAVSYSCSRGYTLIGESTIVCSANGTFQPPPQCLLVNCESPGIRNAVRVGGKSPPYRYKDFVKYMCNEGYTMEGEDYLVCDINGWNPPPPKCIEEAVS